MSVKIGVVRVCPAIPSSYNICLHVNVYAYAFSGLTCYCLSASYGQPLKKFTTNSCTNSVLSLKSYTCGTDDDIAHAAVEDNERDEKDNFSQFDLPEYLEG